MKDELRAMYREVRESAEKSGYKLNPDREFVMELLRGMLVNRKRYGYDSCPCRLASGNPEEDRDIVCPCDYRDDDIEEYGTCYCGLYVRDEDVEFRSIPERREMGSAPVRAPSGLKIPVLRCRICGYLCARKIPPEPCPICGVAGKFDVFIE
ncbi:ferredoxin:glutaredoxin reductase [Methanothermobacter thermautotrophicus]|jgi:ferredoxin-thioredoxin reductase catalytic chain|uniref:ferredoxin:thioredoxin reductase n=1 Tax=Methanothermobacter thermautotrophicus TaxID=145262 RepID=A0A842YKJ4_METTF|nr:ferredoxin-thioredoxin reductase catalytic domain-containing protein [Methanothermobacter thermautotrophicus]MBE2899859.1 ferredoxin:glutaredoxin reductase [Methanothermobacter thermautotrophicus]MCQ8904175.1 ferredoxin:glutaredoxin reductase [Methanothermobacter sp.]